MNNVNLQAELYNICNEWPTKKGIKLTTNLFQFWTIIHNVHFGSYTHLWMVSRNIAEPQKYSRGAAPDPHSEGKCFFPHGETEEIERDRESPGRNFSDILNQRQEIRGKNYLGPEIEPVMSAPPPPPPPTKNVRWGGLTKNADGWEKNSGLHSIMVNIYKRMNVQFFSSYKTWAFLKRHCQEKSIVRECTINEVRHVPLKNVISLL
jgi:hypothetical protein